MDRPGLPVFPQLESTPVLAWCVLGPAPSVHPVRPTTSLHRRPLEDRTSGRPVQRFVRPPDRTEL